MIGIDTNVIVRALIADDVEQSEAARKLLEGLTPASPGWIGQVVLAETFWVLHRVYRVPEEVIVVELSRLMNASDLVIEQHDVVRAALSATSRGADFADALVALGAGQAGASTTMTFDAKAARAVEGMQLLQA